MIRVGYVQRNVQDLILSPSETEREKCPTKTMTMFVYIICSAIYTIYSQVRLKYTIITCYDASTTQCNESSTHWK
jgi:hypothetical protein